MESLSSLIFRFHFLKIESRFAFFSMHSFLFKYNVLPLKFSAMAMKENGGPEFVIKWIKKLHLLFLSK